MRRQIGVNLSGPAFVGVHDDPRLGRTRAHGLKPGHIVGRAQLDLQQRTKGVLGRLRLHRLGAVQRQGIGGDFGAGLDQTGQLPHPLARAFRFQIPQRTVNGVARRTGRQQIIQTHPRNIRRQPVDLIRHAVQRFAIAGIGHTFAHARHVSIRHPNRQHLRLGPGPARNGKNLCQLEHIPRHINAHTSPLSCQKNSRRRHPPPATGAAYKAAIASASRSAPWRNGSTAGMPYSASSSAR